MRLSDFPHCCGAKILSEFPEDYYFRTRKEKIKNIALIRDNLIMASYDQVGIVLAITNRFQLPTSRLLKKFGFKLLRQFYNPNTNYRLKLWELNLNKISEDSIEQIAEKLINSL